MSGLPVQTPLVTSNPTIGAVVSETEPSYEEVEAVRKKVERKALNDLTTGIAISIVAAVILSMIL